MVTVKPNEKILWQTVLNGLIPGKFIRKDGNRIYFRLTKTQGCYNKGEIVDDRALHVIPKKVFRRTGMFTFTTTDDYVFENE